MAFHLIGLGLKANSITKEALEAIQKCDKVYLESFTVNFPYEYADLENGIEHEVHILSREEVEDERILKEASTKEIALLVYGDSLAATTHTHLILTAKKQQIPYKVYHNASILTAVAQTGLQLYKFGKTPSMPTWQKSYEPTSFLNYYKENKSINAHTLLLTDIDLELSKAIEQLQTACNSEGCQIKKLIVISHAGLDDQAIYYEKIKTFEHKTVPMPFCIIIPAEMHHIEEDALNAIKEDIESDE